MFVSRQLGHANPNITLGVYAHLFEHADDAEIAGDALETSYTSTITPARAWRTRVCGNAVVTNAASDAGSALPDRGTYAHLFQEADHAQRAREALEASYEAMNPVN